MKEERTITDKEIMTANNTLDAKIDAVSKKIWIFIILMVIFIGLLVWFRTTERKVEVLSLQGSKEQVSFVGFKEKCLNWETIEHSRRYKSNKCIDLCANEKVCESACLNSENLYGVFRWNTTVCTEYTLVKEVQI